MQLPVLATASTVVRMSRPQAQANVPTDVAETPEDAAETEPLTLWSDAVDFDETNASYWTNEPWDPGTLLNPTPASLCKGSKMSVIFNRQVAATVSEDTAIWSLHFVMRPGTAGLSDHLNASDAAAVETAFFNQYGALIDTHLSAGWTMREVQWRNFGADFPRDPNGVSKYGPLWRVTPAGFAGAAAGARLPDQVALTVTFRTGSRQHWGRVYIGGLVTTVVDSSKFGHARDTTCNDFTLAFKTCFADVQALARQIEPVIWSAKHRGIMSIDQIVCDDVFDVIRSRRAKFATYRSVLSS